MNPALALAQSVYYVSYAGSEYAKCIWIYTLVPFVGSIIAAFGYQMYQTASKSDEKESAVQ